MYNKMSTAVLSAFLITTSLSGGANAAHSTFQDLQNVSGHEKILSLQQKGIVAGVNSTSFVPDQSLTQAEALQLISKGFKLEKLQLTDALISLDVLFPAVKESAWYANAFGYAYNSGVDIPKSVEPLAKITREQFVDYVMTGLQSVGKMPATDVVSQDIADLNKLNPDYLDSVQLAVVFKIIDLAEDKNFNPTREITRAEAAVILYNAVDYLENLDSETSTGLSSSNSYAAPSNGAFFITDSVKRVFEENSIKSNKQYVEVMIFKNGQLVEAEGAEGKAELERLKAQSYDVEYAKSWTYQGNLDKIEYVYLAGYFTEEQLGSFKASDTYGYVFDLKTHGDGSTAQGNR